jgi:hypothetical protein
MQAGWASQSLAIATALVSATASRSQLRRTLANVFAIGPAGRVGCLGNHTGKAAGPDFPAFGPRTCLHSTLRQTLTKIDDYAETAGKRHTLTRQTSGTQPGDPVRASEAIISVACNAAAPRYLVLGAWGYNTVIDYLRKITRDIEGARELSLSADFDAK